MVEQKTSLQSSALEREIRRLIAAAGPMPVAEYMRRCLTDPRYGYYVTRDPLGAGGDFVTAPEITQMFGELIGVWMASVWQAMGAPENVRVVELGPGRGTLMSDALRAARVVSAFRAAIVLHLVEISPTLQKLQERQLQAFDVPILWHGSLAEVPGGPCIIIANEFIDALPVDQAVKGTDGWHQRVVDIRPDGHFAFGIADAALPKFETTLPHVVRDAPAGAIFEWRSDAVAFDLARRARAGGATLVLDYGPSRSGVGDTLQAVSGHAFADPLASPGEVDLTAHVDFEALGIAAESIGAGVHGPVPQRDFLFRLGIHERAAALKARARPNKATEIELALSRLITGGPRGMGELFKALAIADPKLGPLPGFEKPQS
jgi:NADH dehydrogenase [ubiquinone] 1 alpha subcomplex assembly factor 7